LREEVGNDAARFFYILRKREQHLDFDLELAKSTSNENPVYYVQYAHARICSVFRQLEQKKWVWQQAVGEDSLAQLDSAHEKSLLRCLSRYPEVIELAAQTYEPSVIGYYLQDLANEFHAYYNAQLFLVEDDMRRDARLCLIAAVKQVIANGLGMLGVSAPSMM
jgi:arginyl-tRNA synthetase